MTDPIRIAVDGGGSGCRMVLRQGDQRVEVSGGPANVTSAPERAIENLQAGLASLAAAAGLDWADLLEARVCMGLAGVLDDTDRMRVAASFPDFLHLRVEDDRAIALRGAFLNSGTGAVAGIGTGSYVGVMTGGQARFAGGWGFTLGDEASGAWLGREAYRAALSAHDGSGQASDFTENLLQHGPADLMRRAAQMSAPEFAELAPDVAGAARAGDVVAADLMSRGADYLHRTLLQLGWTEDVPLALMGGLGATYVEFLPRPMQIALAERDGSPLDGAFAYAAEMP